MRPYACYIGSDLKTPSVRLLRAAAFSLSLLLAAIAQPANAAKPAAPIGPGTTHVYLLRGVLNIFSLGLDDIAAKLQAQGIPVTVANFMSWSSIADEAAADYKSGRLNTIILVGHSSGATALPDVVARLGELGVPVKLAIGLDSVFRTKLVAGNAEHYLNFYVASGAGEPVMQTQDFRGRLDNIDVEAAGIGHLTIDKNEIMQERVIGAIDAVVFARARASMPAAPRGPARTSRLGRRRGDDRTQLD